MGRVELMSDQGFLIGRVCVQTNCIGGWNWISSLWNAVKCPVMSFWISMGLAWLCAALLLIFRFVFLFCWRIIMACLALDPVGSCLELSFSLGVETFG